MLREPTYEHITNVMQAKLRTLIKCSDCCKESAGTQLALGLPVHCSHVNPKTHELKRQAESLGQFETHSGAVCTLLAVVQ